MTRAYIDEKYYKRIKMFAAREGIDIKDAHEKIISKALDIDGKPKIKELEKITL